MLAVLTQAGVEQALVAHEECFLCVCGVLAGLLEMGLLEMGLLKLDLLKLGSLKLGLLKLGLLKLGSLEMGLLEMGLLEMSLLGWGSRFKGDIELSMVRIRLMRR